MQGNMQPSAEIAKKLAAYDANPVTSTGALNEAMSQFGVPEIRETVKGLRTTLANTQNAYNAVDPSVTGRTQGSLVTDAQRTRQVANERAPIAESMDKQSRALAEGDSTLRDATTQASTIATNRVNDYTAGRQALASTYDTTYQREQNDAASQAARIAAERQQSNADREFSLASSKAGGATKAPGKNDVAAYVVSQFNTLKGGDNKVSNETWQNALNDWTAVGGTVRDFWKNYGDYVNPANKSSYAGYVNR